MNDQMSRMSNARNEAQGAWKRVLCCCSAGMLRSPTIAWVLSNEPYNCNVRAAGLDRRYALILVDKILLEWADEIICVDQYQAERIGELLGDYFPSQKLKPVYFLNIPDNFEFRDPTLVTMIKQELKRINFVGTES